MRGRITLTANRSWFIAVLLLSGCYSGPATSDTLSRPARIEQIEILVMESFPVRITVVVQGYLPDGCTRIADIEQTREGSLFRVSIMTTRPADMMCTTMIVNFEETIPLDVAGLPAGSYMVEVNGMRASFQLP